MKTDHVQARSL